MSQPRFGIDPEARYPADGNRRVEELAKRLLELLPVDGKLERTRDAIQIDVRGSEGIVLLVTPEAVELRLPTVEWTCGAYGPAEASALWKRVEYPETISGDELMALVDAAIEARVLQFTTCRFCGRRAPPEFSVEKDVCQSCAEHHLGVVF